MLALTRHLVPYLVLVARLAIIAAPDLARLMNIFAQQELILREEHLLVLIAVAELIIRIPAVPVHRPVLIVRVVYIIVRPVSLAALVWGIVAPVIIV